MKTPRLRASLSTRFMGPASSPTRAAAPLHQWSSHMSQTTNAVAFGSQWTTSVFPAARRWRSSVAAAGFSSVPEHPIMRAVPIIHRRIINPLSLLEDNGELPEVAQVRARKRDIDAPAKFVLGRPAEPCRRLERIAREVRRIDEVLAVVDLVLLAH